MCMSVFGRSPLNSLWRHFIHKQTMDAENINLDNDIHNKQERQSVWSQPLALIQRMFSAAGGAQLEEENKIVKAIISPLLAKSQMSSELYVAAPVPIA